VIVVKGALAFAGPLFFCLEVTFVSPGLSCIFRLVWGVLVCLVFFQPCIFRLVWGVLVCLVFFSAVYFLSCLGSFSLFGVFLAVYFLSCLGAVWGCLVLLFGQEGRITVLFSINYHLD